MNVEASNPDTESFGLLENYEFTASTARISKLAYVLQITVSPSISQFYIMRESVHLTQSLPLDNAKYELFIWDIEQPKRSTEESI